MLEQQNNYLVMGLVKIALQKIAPPKKKKLPPVKVATIVAIN